MQKKTSGNHPQTGFLNSTRDGVSLKPSANLHMSSCGIE